MLLRASGETQGDRYDLQAVTDESAQSGVPHGEALTSFAEACVRGRSEELRDARDALGREMSAEAVVDAAAVAANFQRMVRIADATGIPLDKPVAIFSVDMREQLGIDAFGAAANTPQVGPVLRTLGRLLRPLAVVVMSFYAKKC